MNGRNFIYSCNGTTKLNLFTVGMATRVQIAHVLRIETTYQSVNNIKMYTECKQTIQFEGKNIEQMCSRRSPERKDQFQSSTTPNECKFVRIQCKYVRLLTSIHLNFMDAIK